jgi:hypothetical protein
MTRAHWAAVEAWFGRIPSFHDCEVVSIDLHRAPEPSIVCVHAFLMTPELDDQGYYVLDKHALVSFRLFEVREVNIMDWNHQNVLDSIAIEDVENGFRLMLEGTYGADGHITAAAVEIAVHPVAAEDIERTFVARRARTGR